MRAADNQHEDVLRQAAGTSLVRLARSDSAVMDAILKVLQEPRSFRRAARKAALVGNLGELGQADPEVVKALISALDDVEAVRQAAIRSLIRLGENAPGILGALVQALGAPNYSISEAAAEVLGRLGRTNLAISGTLLRILGKHFSDVSDGAASVLVEIANCGPGVADRLLVAFRSDNWRVRLAAVRILSRGLSPSSMGRGDANQGSR